MRLPDLLATPRGRLTAFFFLYLTEGIPLGFTATAVATQMRRMGVSPSEIGQFVGALYLPWAWKWAIGPFVDTLSWDRMGRRRMWIVAAQVGMVLTLLSGMGIELSSDIGLFTTLILVHNVFGATQDVAIDALAVGTLKEEERGLANGLMFGGAYLGQAVGGSGVLFLIPYIGLKGGFLFVAGCIAAVTIFITLPLKEKQRAAPIREGPLLRSIGQELLGFLQDSVKAIFGSRRAFLGLVFAALPAGGMALSLALASNLAVELDMSDDQIAMLTLWSTVISAIGCVAGGAISDRFGRRRMLALYIATTALPTLWLAGRMAELGWILPVDPTLPNRPPVPEALVTAFWMASLVYAASQGLMYGTRTALFMDVTEPAVAATQFTAYMAVLNLCTTYSATWQGHALEVWGYPATLRADAAFGLLCLLCLPFITPRPAGGAPPA